MWVRSEISIVKTKRGWRHHESGIAVRQASLLPQSMALRKAALQWGAIPCRFSRQTRARRSSRSPVWGRLRKRIAKYVKLMAAAAMAGNFLT